jgi:uncharacterized protein
VREKSLIVSLHDVAPSTFALIRQQVEELAALGVNQTSLLVIPYHHGIKKLEDDSALCSWLFKQQELGHEMVLHGWEHRIPNSKGTSNASTWFYENLYTSREAEFLNLNRQEASQLIGEGLDMFRKLGLKPEGFIAPAWLMNPDVEHAAREHKLLYTNTISELIQLPTNRRVRTRSCVWSTRAGWRRGCSLIWNRFLFQKLQSADPLRISLHPNDLHYPAIWSQIRDLIRVALQERHATTYQKWIEQRFSDSDFVASCSRS